nr:MAG TPA: hypothetical protein [Caudoviricetes sp.]
MNNYSAPAIKLGLFIFFHVETCFLKFPCDNPSKIVKIGMVYAV